MNKINKNGCQDIKEFKANLRKSMGKLLRKGLDNRWSDPKTEASMRKKLMQYKMDRDKFGQNF